MPVRPLLLSILLLAALAPVANGAGASTNVPDPLTAAVVDDDLPVVRACFDGPVGTAVASRFTVVDYDSAQRVAGASVRPGAAAATCVDVVFPDGTAVRQDSLLEFAAGAAGDGTSTPGAAPLQGSTLAAAPGRTQAPDLLSAAAAGDQVVFTFDEALDPGLAASGTAADPSQFGLLDGQGQWQAARSIVGVDGATITVGFSGGATMGATRFTTAAGAVRDRRCAAGQAACGVAKDWDASPPGQAGAAPAALTTLVSATPDASGSVIDLQWSGPITPTGAGAVGLYREDGRPATGTFTVAQLDAKTLRLTLAPDFPDPGSIVLAAADRGAVPIRAGAQAPGRTDAPDLLSVAHSANTVTYTFDQAVVPDLTQASVGWLGPDGSAHFGSPGAVSADGRSVSATFSGALPAIISAGVVPVGGVLDAAGDAAPLGAVAPNVTMAMPTVTAVATAAPTAAPTVAPLPTSTPAATAAPVALRKRRGVGATVTVLMRHNRRVSGLVVADAPCQKNRKLVASAGGRTLGKAKTGKHGAFSIKARKLVATRIKVTVSKRVIKRRRITIVCQTVSAKV